MRTASAKRYVLDASVAAKWVLRRDREPFSQQSDYLLGALSEQTVELLVPDFFWLEVSSILCKSVRRGRLSQDGAFAAHAFIRELDLKTASTLHLTAEALRIAIAFQRSVYDSAYICLAVASGCEMITADEKLVNAVGAHLPVRHIAYADLG